MTSNYVPHFHNSGDEFEISYSFNVFFWDYKCYTAEAFRGPWLELMRHANANVLYQLMLLSIGNFRLVENAQEPKRI